MLHRLKAQVSPALVISLIALFVSLGGAGYAAVTVTGKNVKNSSLTGKDVKNSSLTGKDVKNSSLTGGDVKNGSIAGADLASGVIPSSASSVAPNAVTSEGLAAGSVTTSKLADGAVTTGKLADDAVTGAKLVDGSLSAGDVATFNATLTVDFASLAAGTCARQLLAIPGSGDTSNDSVLVTADANDLILAPSGGGFNLVVLGQGSNATENYRVVLCNPSAAAVDPPSARYYVTAFAR